MTAPPMPIRPWRVVPDRKQTAISISSARVRSSNADKRSILSSRPLDPATAREVPTRSDSDMFELFDRYGARGPLQRVLISGRFQEMRKHASSVDNVR